MLTFPTHRHLSNSPKTFLLQKMFSSCLHLHLVSHQEADIYGEKNLTHLTLNIFLIFDFITYS